jgi:transposase InsO family protein
MVCMGTDDPTSQSKATLWHTRLGHQGHTVLNEVNTQFKLNISRSDLDRIKGRSCLTCTRGKSIRTAIHSTAHPQYKVTNPLQCLHADLVGPVTIIDKSHRPRCPSVGGHLYALIVTDEATHAVFIRLLREKSDASDELINLIKQQQIRTGRILERFHSDGGGEFRGSSFRSFLEDNGTRFTHTTASTPAHNGVAERMNRTLFEIMRTSLIQASAPEEMWGEALDWAAHLYNITPHPVTNNMSPFQLLYNYRYNIQKLRVWGCDAHVRLLPGKQSKVQSRTWSGIFVGFHPETASYRVMNSTTRVVTHSNDVHFDEHSFIQIKKMSSKSRNSNPTNTHLNPFSALGELLEDDELGDYDDVATDSTIASVTDVDNEDDVDSSDVVEVVNDEIDPPDDSSIEALDESKYDSESELEINTEAEEPAAPVKMTRDLRNILTQYDSWNERHIQPVLNDTGNTRSGRAIVPPTDRPISSDPNAYDPSDMHYALTQREYANIAMVESVINAEPKQYKDAIRSPDAAEWKVAMQEEIDSMNQLRVWSIISCPKGVTPIKGRWVFKNKLGDNNQLLRRKARFVAKGFLQVHGRDFFDTHSPVAKMKSIKLMLSLTAQRDLELQQLDFDTAFLNAPVKEDIYLEQPEGFHTGTANMVCKLNMAIYGLKQAPHEWNRTIDTFMKKLGYRALRCDPCVYIKYSKNNRLIIICLYVDDTVIAFDRADLAEWTADKKSIAATYAIKDLGECQWILNMKVIRDRPNHIITLSQEAYVERIIDEYGMREVRSATNPATVGDLYLPADGSTPIRLSTQQVVLYQQMVGALLYAANITRIDIAFIVSQLCRYTSKPCVHQLEAAKQVFKYLRDTSSTKLIFGQSNTDPDEVNITAYSDANWGGDQETGKSTTGCLIRFNGDIINWLSRRQKSVAQSSAESEYMALAETVKEVLWYRSWIHEVFNQWICGTVKCDNQAAIKLSDNDTIHDRSKHIHLRYHFIRDEVLKQHIQINWVCSQEQQADILTKALGTKVFVRLRNLLLVN